MLRLNNDTFEIVALPYNKYIVLTKNDEPDEIYELNIDVESTESLEEQAYTYLKTLPKFKKAIEIKG